MEQSRVTSDHGNKVRSNHRKPRASAPATAIERQKVAGGRRDPGGDGQSRPEADSVPELAPEHRLLRRRVRVYTLLLFLVAIGVVAIFTGMDRPLQQVADWFGQGLVHIDASRDRLSGRELTSAERDEATVEKPGSESITDSEADNPSRSHPSLIGNSGAIDVSKYQQASLMLKSISRLIPELKDDPRYQSLVEEVDWVVRSHRDSAADSVVPDTPKPDASPNTSAPNTSAPELPETETDTQPPHSKPPALVVPPSSPAPTGFASKAAAAPTPLTTPSTPPASAVQPATKQPELMNISVTQGVVRDNQFLPKPGGREIMVRFDYRNFQPDKGDRSPETLVAHLQLAGDPLIVAEAPVRVPGDRGSKSFSMNTRLPDNASGNYRLQFILHGEPLASMEVRLQALSR